ncbi:uncharacterized protein [Branchiostoma lanceolatum]|uniref:uncharacterized protein n=1 Tax=Branchiostoma lanceolatum TaxID=7740 RepID=UPI003456B568
MGLVFCSGCGNCAKEGDNFYSRCGKELRKLLEDEVNCSPYITHSDVARFRYNNHNSLLDKDRRLLQEALTLVTSENQWVWRNAQITVYGQQVKAVFYSGDRTNKFVVHLDSADCPTHVVEKKGWGLWVKDGFKTAWGWISSAASTVAGALTGGLAKLAIGWFS